MKNKEEQSKNKSLNSYISNGIIAVYLLVFILTTVSLIFPEWIKKINKTGKEQEAREYSTYGDQFLNQGQYAKAIIQFNKAISICPNQINTYINRGICNYYLGDITNAIADFKEVLNSKDILHSEVYYYLGEIFNSQNNPQKALRYYLRSAQSAPYPIFAYQKAGEIFNNNKQFDLAKKAFNLAFHNQFTMKNCYNGMLIKNYYLFDMKNVRKDINQLKKQDITQLDLSSFDEKIFNQQAQMHPINATLYNQYGYLYIQTKKLDSAKICFEKALQIQPDFIHAKKNLDMVNHVLIKQKPRL